MELSAGPDQTVTADVHDCSLYNYLSQNCCLARPVNLLLVSTCLCLPGDITSRLSNDTSLTSRSIAANVNIFLRTLVNVVGVLCFAFALSRQLTIVMFVESPLTILVQKLYNQYYLKQVQEVQDSIGRSNQLAGEIVSSMRTVRSFATEDWESERFNKKLQETGQLRNKRDLIRAVYLLCHRHLQLLMEVVILYYGQYLVRTGQMTTGNLVAFFLYQTNYRNHVQTLVHMCSDMSLSMGAAERVFEYLDRKPAIRCDGTLVPEILTGHLEFKNVSFSYPMRPHTQVLKDVSFEVRSGEMTALVGVTGGGKTTCVSLLQRFYEPQSGRILLDGHPIEEYQHQYYHRKVSLVSQEPVLFAGSVRDNIRYGLESCLHSAVTEAAEKADAREFIEAMDQGYDTDVGESGAQISVGEKQRIAIARALVRQPQLLVLDEATSSLDVQTELTIQRALSKGAQTTLVIAHRLKTVEQADKIIVMEGGRVVEQGTHQQLMEKGGCYNRMVQLLFSDRE
ncbi:antigen peptide transporter 2a [Narcine bancroftii]|uniref:antigen peptide transporter 2a n=1 Tax=Narcine bancroftii TaxID=1343680 RepID=UPI003831F8FC